jgi:acetylglutamate kinase
VAVAGPVVVKLGGDVLEGEVLVAVADALHAVLASTEPGSARRIAVVHGGGPQVTALSARLGVEARIVAGRRVTDRATLDVLKMVIAGRLNIDLCAALQARGVLAVGLHAGSGTVRARRRPPRVISGGGPDPVDLGLVGDVVGFDLGLLDTLWSTGRVPVLSSLGINVAGDAGASGDVLNLNADLVASRLAGALAASLLVAVTAVGGVRRNQHDPSSRIARLTVGEARAAIAAGVVQGGMIPKLEEAFVPLEAGVAGVQIVAPHELAGAVRDPGSVGTLLVPDPRA